MAALGITILKHNVPWGPFTRAQIEDGIARGDFTVKYLAHAPGLKEWLPLGEVLDYVARHESLALPTLPPVPEVRELPPVPTAPPMTAVTAPVILSAPVSKPPDLPAPPAKEPEPAPPKPQSRPVVTVPSPLPAPEPVAEPERELEPASLFARGIAFLVDCGILFIPVVILFALGMLSIYLPSIFSHTSQQALLEKRELVWVDMQRLAGWLVIGCGWFYGAGYESSARQATIGKRWMGLKVADTRGERLSFLRASGRYAAKYLSALPCFLGFIMALFSSRNLALHDRLAGTRVVKD